MATLAYPYSVRDSANSTTDNRKAGLTPTVSNGKTLAASPATVLASTVTVVEVGSGDYVALYDAETNLDASFPIDWGSGLANPNDRYGTLILTRDAGRILTALPNAAANANGGLPVLSVSGTTLGYTVTTATTLANLPAVPTDWLTAAGVKADAVTKVQSGLATPTNITAATGVVLSPTTHTGAVIPTVTTVGTLTTYTGNTPQTGDSFALASGSSGFVAIKGNTAAIAAKLPANAIADETLVLAAVGSPMQAGASVALATSQPNYAPAKAGDAMTLTSAYDPAKTAAQAGSAPTWFPAHFTNATFASDGVFSVAALANAPASSGGGSITVAGYAAGQDPATLLAAAGYTTTRAGKLDNLDAAITTRSVYAGGAVASVTAGVAVASIAAGSISSASFTTGTVNAGATGLLERLLLLVGRYFPTGSGSVTCPKSGNGSIVVKNAAGTTVATQPVTDNGTTQTLGAAS